MPKKTDGADISFEEALSKLGGIVEKLEGKSVPLEESVKLYEEGRRLSRLCREKLAIVEKRLEEIDKNSPAED